jgi:hypothetical protein
MHTASSYTVHTVRQCMALQMEKTAFDSVILHPCDRDKYFPLFMVCKTFVKPWYTPAQKTLYSVFIVRIFKHVAEFWIRQNVLSFHGEVWFCTVCYRTRQPPNIARLAWACCRSLATLGEATGSNITASIIWTTHIYIKPKNALFWSFINILQLLHVSTYVRHHQGTFYMCPAELHKGAYGCIIYIK